MTHALTGMRPAAWSIAAASAALLAGPAWGQGTNGLLPGPISSRDLAVYGERLDMTDEQRHTLDPFHAEYLEMFRQLRERDIEELMDEIGGMWRRGFRSLNREAIEDSIRKGERVMNKISLLDERMFDHLQTVIDDEQMALLPRVMKARERERYRTGGSWMAGSANRAARVDLSRIYFDLELTEEERRATDPFIAQYESKLTAATKKLYEATTRVFLDVLDSLEEQGVSLENFGQPGQGRPPREMWDAMRNARTEASKKPREKAAAIGDLNRQSLRQVSEVLSPSSASTLRSRYLRRAYPELPASSAQRSYRAALRLTDLGDAVREDIEQMAAAFREQRHGAIDEMIGDIDEYRRAPQSFDRRKRQAYEEKLETHRQRLAGIDESAIEALQALLGPDLARTVQLAAAGDGSSGDEPDEGPGRGRGGGDLEEAIEAFAAGLGPDPFLPRPINRHDVARYRERLNVGENDRFILESLHEEYISGYKQVRQTDIAALRGAQAGLWPPAEEAEDPPEGERVTPEPPTAQQIDEVYDLRQHALKSIMDLDAALFDDVEMLVASEELLPTAQRLRRARERFVYNRGINQETFSAAFGRRGGRRGSGGRGNSGSSGSGQSNEAGVDLSALADELDLSPEQRAKSDKILADYEVNANEGFRRQYESSLRLRREAEKLRAQSMQAAREEDREARRSRWQAYQRLNENEGRKASEDRRYIVELNRATLASLTEALPEELAEELRLAFKREAFPTLYDDPRSAAHYLAQALELPDLADEQRARIEAILGEYRPAHDRVREQIAELYAAAEDASGRQDREQGERGQRDRGQRDRSRWQRTLERRNKLEVLSFQRNELNSRTVRELRSVLTEEQQARIRLPNEVAEQESGSVSIAP